MMLPKDGHAGQTLGLTEQIRAIPITEPEAVQTIGLVLPARAPMTPIAAALVEEARRVAPMLEEDSPVRTGRRRG